MATDTATTGPHNCTDCGCIDKGASGAETHPNGEPCLICKSRKTGRCPVGWNGQPAAPQVP